MGNYYYLAASLPMLKPELSPPLSVVEFLDQCQRQLTPADYAVLRSAKMNNTSVSDSVGSIIRKWKEMEFGLRNELVKLRAKNTGKDAEAYLQPESLNPLASADARRIVDEATPYKSELEFGRTLWKFIEELEVGQMFTLEFLVCYYLKLQILERNATFNIEKGKQKLESIISGDANE